MKYVQLVLLAYFIITSCSNSKSDSQNLNNDLPIYEIIQEEIFDVPLKTKVILKILLKEKNVTEQKIKNLLNYLYNKTIKRSGFKHHRHPTNIYIYIYTSKYKAESGKGQWIGMIAKNFDEKAPRIFINEFQLNSLKEKKEEKWELSYEQRKEIWKKMIINDRKAQTEADKKYPLDKPDAYKKNLKSNADLMKKLKKKYKKQLAEEYKIEKAIIDSIVMEGVTNGWEIPK